MAEQPPTRSVKIGADERTGWSSERPRREGAKPGDTVTVPTPRGRRTLKVVAIGG